MQMKLNHHQEQLWKQLDHSHYDSENLHNKFELHLSTWRITCIFFKSKKFQLHMKKLYPRQRDVVQ
jgi:hypothetical protein